MKPIETEAFMRRTVGPQAHFFGYFLHHFVSAAQTRGDYNRIRPLTFSSIDGNCENKVAWGG